MSNLLKVQSVIKNTFKSNHKKAQLLTGRWCILIHSALSKTSSISLRAAAFFARSSEIGYYEFTTALIWMCKPKKILLGNKVRQSFGPTGQRYRINFSIRSSPHLTFGDIYHILCRSHSSEEYYTARTKSKVPFKSKKPLFMSNNGWSENLLDATSTWKKSGLPFANITHANRQPSQSNWLQDDH